MSTAIGGRFGGEVIARLRDMQNEASAMTQGKTPKDQAAGASFADHLKQGIDEVNQLNKTADKMGMELSTGRSANIHDTMLAATQAELAFNLMVQIRNKALEAYSDIMKMPV
jgi:flagellar hook-basal body complex protein FliE